MDLSETPIWDASLRDDRRGFRRIRAFTALIRSGVRTVRGRPVRVLAAILPVSLHRLIVDEINRRETL